MSARDDALIELDRKELPGWPAELRRQRRGGDAGPADTRHRALTGQIVIGVVKNHLHLRHLIGHYSGRSLKGIETLVQKIMSIGLYQLRFLTRIPASAAVNEAVEQAKRFGRPKAAGFINAVLRKAAREGDVAMPDRAADPAGYAELALSHARALFERLAGLMGAEGALGVCEHDNRQPPTIVRLFAGKGEVDLRAGGVEVRPHEQAGMYVVAARVDVLRQWAEGGIAQVQDATAAGVVAGLEIAAGQRLLDRCCGMGTKTLQMRDVLGESGSILAVDPSEQRAAALQSLIERRGIGNVRVWRTGMMREAEGEEQGAAGGKAEAVAGRTERTCGEEFDGILIDVPCSNSGVLARRAEARYAQDAKTIASLGKLQRRILDDTAPLLKAGGRLVYSTCSIWPEENQGQILAFIARHAEYHLIEEHTTLPSVDASPARYHDGGYYAVLTR